MERLDRNGTTTGPRPLAPSPDLYDLLPADHRMSYDMHTVLKAIVDDGKLDEFQQDLAREMICGDARISGIPVGVIANQRGLVKGRPGEKPRFGGIVYATGSYAWAFGFFAVVPLALAFRLALALPVPAAVRR